jgi:hypothetical protein
LSSFHRGLRELPHEQKSWFQLETTLLPTFVSGSTARKVVELQKLHSLGYFSEWTKIILGQPYELGEAHLLENRGFSMVFALDDPDGHFASPRRC